MLKKLCTSLTKGMQEIGDYYLNFAYRVPVPSISRDPHNLRTQLATGSQIINETIYVRLGIVCAIVEQIFSLISLFAFFRGSGMILEGSYWLGRFSLGMSHIGNWGKIKNMFKTGFALFSSGIGLSLVLKKPLNFTTYPLQWVKTSAHGLARSLIDSDHIPKISWIKRLFLNQELLPTIIASDFYQLNQEAFYRKYSSHLIHSHPMMVQITRDFSIWMLNERERLPEAIQRHLPSPNSITLHSIFTLFRDHRDWHTSPEWRQGISRLMTVTIQNTLLNHREFCELFLSHLGCTQIDDPIAICKNRKTQDFIHRIGRSQFTSYDYSIAVGLQISWLMTHLSQENR